MGSGVQKRFCFSNLIWQKFFEPYTLFINPGPDICYPSPESHKDVDKSYLEGLLDGSVWPRWSLDYENNDLHWPRGCCLFRAGPSSNSSELWFLEGVAEKKVLKLRVIKDDLFIALLGRECIFISCL